MAEEQAALTLCNQDTPFTTLYSIAMKTKSLLFIIAAAILLSFTVISNQSNDMPAATASSTVTTTESTPNSGFAMEDPNQW